MDEYNNSTFIDDVFMIGTGGIKLKETGEQVQVTVGIRYDNAEIFDAAGNATLTGADLDQTVSNATGGGTVGS